MLSSEELRPDYSQFHADSVCSCVTLHLNKTALTKNIRISVGVSAYYLIPEISNLYSLRFTLPPEEPEISVTVFSTRSYRTGRGPIVETMVRRFLVILAWNKFWLGAQVWELKNSTRFESHRLLHYTYQLLLFEWISTCLCLACLLSYHEAC